MNVRIKNITTTLPISIIQELEVVSKSLGLPKNQILVDAFTEWNKKRKKAALLSQYKKMAEDSEMLELAESGISDFEKNIKLWEK